MIVSGCGKMPLRRHQLVVDVVRLAAGRVEHLIPFSGQHTGTALVAEDLILVHDAIASAWMYVTELGDQDIRTSKLPACHHHNC